MHNLRLSTFSSDLFSSDFHRLYWVEAWCTKLLAFLVPLSTQSAQSSTGQLRCGPGLSQVTIVGWLCCTNVDANSCPIYHGLIFLFIGRDGPCWDIELLFATNCTLVIAESDWEHCLRDRNLREVQQYKTFRDCTPVYQYSGIRYSGVQLDHFSPILAVFRIGSAFLSSSVMNRSKCSSMGVPVNMTFDIGLSMR